MSLRKRRRIARHILLCRRELVFNQWSGQPKFDKLFRGPISVKDWEDPAWRRRVIVDPTIRRRRQWPISESRKHGMLPPLYQNWGYTSEMWAKQLRENPIFITPDLEALNKSLKARTEELRELMKNHVIHVSPRPDFLIPKEKPDSLYRGGPRESGCEDREGAEVKSWLIRWFERYVHRPTPHEIAMAFAFNELYDAHARYIRASLMAHAVGQNVSGNGLFDSEWDIFKRLEANYHASYGKEWLV